VERRQSGRLVGRKAETDEPSLAALIHLRLQGLDEREPVGDAPWRPFAGGEYDEGIEDVGVKAGGVGEGVVAAFDGGPESVSQRRVDGNSVLEVRLAVRNMAGLVLQSESRDLAGHGVRSVTLEERQQGEEGALAQHREQKRRQ
jgi:hypothetical protein